MAYWHQRLYLYEYVCSPKKVLANNGPFDYGSRSVAVVRMFHQPVEVTPNLERIWIMHKIGSMIANWLVGWKLIWCNSDARCNAVFQIATSILQSMTVYYKMQQVYYKVRCVYGKVRLYITKCNTIFKKRESVLQSATKT